jgi:hypothetical protein
MFVGVVSLPPATVDPQSGNGETQSSSSFVFVNRDGVVTPKYHHAMSMLCKLRPGFKWQRQLVFRSKLTMHTAFERKDNLQPAPVTAIAPSR